MRVENPDCLNGLAVYYLISQVRQGLPENFPTFYATGEILQQPLPFLFQNPCFSFVSHRIFLLFHTAFLSTTPKNWSSSTTCAAAAPAPPVPPKVPSHLSNAFICALVFCVHVSFACNHSSLDFSNAAQTARRRRLCDPGGRRQDVGCRRQW